MIRSKQILQSIEVRLLHPATEDRLPLCWSPSQKQRQVQQHGMRTRKDAEPVCRVSVPGLLKNGPQKLDGIYAALPHLQEVHRSLQVQLKP